MYRTHDAGSARLAGFGPAASNRRFIVAFAPVALLITMMIFLGLAQSARAEVVPVNGQKKICWGETLAELGGHGNSDYCVTWGGGTSGETKFGPTYVYGNYKVEAWSPQHSVCVRVGSETSCSTGGENHKIITGEICNGCSAPVTVTNNASSESTVYGWIYEYPTKPVPPNPIAWHYKELGGQFLGKPSISATGPGHENVFVRGLDGNLWQKWTSNNGASWSEWQNVSGLSGSGPIASGPGAYAMNANRVDVVARMPNSTVGHWYSEGGGAWHYENLGAEQILGEPEIVSANNGYLDILARGLDGNLWEKQWNNGYWGAWSNISAIIGGPIAGSPGAVSASVGTLTIVGRKANNHVGVWSVSGPNWSYQELAGEIEGDPDIASTGSNHVNVFAQGLDGNLWQMWTPGSGWSAWQQLSTTPIQSSPGAVGSSTEEVDVVARNSSGTAGYWWYGR